MTEKITVMCVKFGTLYNIGYVEKLRNMVAKHLTVPYEMVCLTDDPYPVDGVRSIIQPKIPYKKVWWHKVHMFDPELPVSGTILYFDLDLIIHQNIDKLVNYKPNEFVGIRDFIKVISRKDIRYLNSSVMRWEHGKYSQIYTRFKETPEEALSLPGDQDWIWKVLRLDIQYYPDSWIQSYKWQIRSVVELTALGELKGYHGFKTVSDKYPTDPECCVAVFHGYPKPEKVKDKFVLENWR